MKTFKKLFLLFLLVFTVSSCNNKNEKKDSNIKNENIEQKAKKLQEGTVEVSKLDNSYQIIDTRDVSKYLGWENENKISGHIENAMDFPKDWFNYVKSNEILDAELKRRGLDKQKKTLIYSDGNVDYETCKNFLNLGFTDLHSLKGGINEYAKNNKKLEKLEGYKMFVSPKWVEDLINGKKPLNYNGEKYKIVEVYLKSEEESYKNKHIKNAIGINADEFNHIPGPRNIQEYEGIDIKEQRKFWGFYSDDEIKTKIENLGIDKDTMVILYGTEKATTAAYRAGLVFDYAGVKNIKFINGGKPLWMLENRKLSSDEVKTEKSDFKAKVPQNPNIVFDYKKELNLINDKNATIASVRSFSEYLGEKSGYTYIDKAGDIKGSRFAYAGSNPYAMEDYRNLDNTMFNYKVIENRWKKWGIVPEKTVSFHCGTGWRASETYYIAKALSFKNVGVYVGGWYEWTKLADSPVKENGLPKDAPENKPNEIFYDRNLIKFPK